jgi:phosphoribosylaminoimidazolecarboxamide formyltransferase/IMP cyclohydrolase
MRFNPAVRALPFKKEVKKVDRTNARVHFINDSLTSQELPLFEQDPKFLTEEEKSQWMKTLKGVSLSSDAFFPFRDSIDVAAKLGVSFVAHPGGSIQDDSVTGACNEYGMVMATTGVRLFHH